MTTRAPAVLITFVPMSIIQSEANIYIEIANYKIQIVIYLIYKNQYIGVAFMPTDINLSLLYSYTLAHFAKLKSMCTLFIL